MSEDEKYTAEDERNDNSGRNWADDNPTPEPTDTPGAIASKARKISSEKTALLREVVKQRLPDPAGVSELADEIQAATIMIDGVPADDLHDRILATLQTLKEGMGSDAPKGLGNEP